MMHSQLTAGVIISEDDDAFGEVLALVRRLEFDGWPRPEELRFGRQALHAVLKSLTGIGHDLRGDLHVAGVRSRFHVDLRDWEIRAIISSRVDAIGEGG
jgi:hypothetical protein